MANEEHSPSVYFSQPSVLIFQRAYLIPGQSYFNIRKMAYIKTSHIKSRLAKKLKAFSCIIRLCTLSKGWHTSCQLEEGLFFYLGCLCVSIRRGFSEWTSLLLTVTSCCNELHRASSFTLQYSFILVTVLLQSHIPQAVGVESISEPFPFFASDLTKRRVLSVREKAGSMYS